MNKTAEARKLAGHLNLKHLANGDVILKRATDENIDFLYEILETEYEMRQEEKRRRLLKQSRMPMSKEFDFTLLAGILIRQTNELANFDFKNKLKNILIYGKSCTGKTSLACEIGRSAIHKGVKTLYVSFGELVSAYTGKTSLWKSVVNSELVIIDDFLYLLPSETEMVRFYKAVSFLIESRSLILISNRDVLGWKNLGYDDNLMETLLARLTNKAHQIRL